MPAEFIMVLVMCLLVLVASRTFWRQRITQARNRIIRNKNGAIRISLSIRDQARKTLLIKRQMRRIHAELNKIQTDIESAQSTISTLSLTDDRIFVVDDSRHRADTEWIAVVAHEDYKQLISHNAPQIVHNTWKSGRRCLVWAPTREAAVGKILAFYPPEKGFRIISIADTKLKPEMR